VGADRIVNAVAAFSRHKGLHRRDFRTATTFDYVSSGRLLGGSSPRARDISAEAPSGGLETAGVEIAKPTTVIGKNTVAAMQSGSSTALSRSWRDHRPDEKAQ
jgi:type III pantothenate kinase